MTRRSIFLVLVLISSSCAEETCARDIEVAIQDRVYTRPNSVTFKDVVHYEEDAFLMSIVDQNVRKLCQNSVSIDGELLVLYISNASIADIEDGAFQIAPTLGLLKISHNPLTTLRRGMFKNVNSKELDLTHNAISVIHNDTFDDMPKLEVVRLSNNAIKELNSDWFRGSPNVYKLSIIYNELSTIPSGAFKNMAKNRGLRLRLSANQINNIHIDAFEGVADIEVLWINGNKLRQLPDSMFLNRTIQRLELNTNKLMCFPDALYQSTVRSLAFVDNSNFGCECLRKVRHFVEEKHIDIKYPAIICEDRKREVNIVFNFNKTYELPILPPPSEQTQ